MISAPHHWLDASELLDSEWDELVDAHRALGHSTIAASRLSKPPPLDERGESERALHALTAVDFWNFLAGGPSMEGALEAAHAMARCRRWAHLTVSTGAVRGQED
jgi:hypothetical protein